MSETSSDGFIFKDDDQFDKECYKEVVIENENDKDKNKDVILKSKTKTNFFEMIGSLNLLSIFG